LAEAGFHETPKYEGWMARLRRQWSALKRAWLIRRFVRFINSCTATGIPPLTLKEWLLLLLVAILMFLVLFGGVGILVAPPPAPR
jgi:hypothetical protein